jgi:hypothetical protein
MLVNTENTSVHVVSFSSRELCSYLLRFDKDDVVSSSTGFA